MREDLKNYNNELAYFVLFNIALFIWIELDFKFIIENYELLSVLLTIPLYYFPIYLFNNLMPSDWKFFVLYPLKHNHHYASDIFTKIDSGKIIYINLKQLNMDINDMLEQVRSAGYFDLYEAESAVMEANGNLSILPKSDYKTITLNDMNIKKENSRLCANVIIDGKIMSID